jgi:hypothetical protein
MLRSVNELRGCALQAVDGEIGRTKDFLFDDVDWAIRYMVADTGRWIPKRRVLITPISIGEPNWIERRIPVLLTKQEIEDAPAVSEDEPVSRQHETALLMHHGYAPYWLGPDVWGGGIVPSFLRDEAFEADDDGLGISTSLRPRPDPHLQSADEVVCYHVRATDDEVGRISDFILDDESWVVRYVVVDTGGWLSGRKVLAAPDWFVEFDWNSATATVDMTRAQIEAGPIYDAALTIDRSFEARLYEQLGRTSYWD